MSRGPRLKSISGIYHIMWRGANKQEIFHDDEDCRKFLAIIEKYKTKSGMEIYAWCLMNNHVHLLLREGNEELSTTMKRIGVSFAWYYNWKYGTTGHLFQGRYKSENVENDWYLQIVVRYIHQNPVKAGIVGRVDEWKWSSCPDYYGKQYSSKKLLDPGFILNKFSADRATANTKFKEFNELTNTDECLDETVNIKRRLSDEEARAQMKELLGALEIPQVKSLPRQQRNEALRKIKEINGLSQRQAARILGISANLIFRA